MRGSEMDIDNVMSALCECVNDAERIVASIQLSRVRLSVSAICRRSANGQQLCTVRPRILPALKVTQSRTAGRCCSVLINTGRLLKLCFVHLHLSYISSIELYSAAACVMCSGCKP